MNKSIRVLLAFFSLFVISPAFSQQQKLHKVWEAKPAPSSSVETKHESPTQDQQSSWQVVTYEGKPMYTVFFDGGSIGIPFKKGAMSVTLYHDRSYKILKIEGNEDFPDSEHWVNRTDGLLYLGQENFKKRIPVSVEDPLLLELEESMITYLDTKESPNDDDLETFLKTLKKMRSNQAVLTTSEAAPPTS